MAVSDVHCSVCGEVAKRVSRGNRRNTDRYASWIESQGVLCSDCWKKDQEKKSAEAAENAKSQGLPQLTGSEKQIAWAEKIRMDMIQEVQNDHRKNEGKHSLKCPTLDEFVNEFLKSQTDSKWFIENRHKTAFENIVAPAWMIEKIQGSSNENLRIMMENFSSYSKLSIENIAQVLDVSGEEF